MAIRRTTHEAVVSTEPEETPESSFDDAQAVRLSDDDGDADVDIQTADVGDQEREPASDVTVIPATESMTFTVSLPIQVHETPEDEAAISITDVAISPDYMDVSGPATTTITLISDEVARMPDTGPVPEVVIPALPEPDDVYSRRGRQRGEGSTAPEPSTMLTAERLIPNGKRGRTPAPEGFWQQVLYTTTFHLVNVGDSYAVRQRKSLDSRISKHF